MFILPLSPGFFLRGLFRVTKGLLWVNIASFLLFNVFLDDTSMRSLYLRSSQSPVWSYVTYSFLHGDITHLLGNMIFLVPFCAIVEEKIGSLKTFLLYLVSVAAAGGAWVLLNETPSPLVGASGGVAAMMGASMVLRPHVRVPGVFLVFIFPLLFFSMPAWIWASVYFLIDNWEFLLSLASSVQVAIAYEAHIAGFVFAFAVCWMSIRCGLIAGTSSDLLGSLGKIQPGSGTTIPDNRLPTLIPEALGRLQAGEAMPAEGLLALARLAASRGRGVEAYKLLQEWISSHDTHPLAAEVAIELGLISLRFLSRPDLARDWFEDALRRGASGELRERIETAMRIL